MAARSGKVTAPVRQPGNPIGQGHNARTVDETQQAQLLSFVNKVEGHDREIAKLKLPFDSAKEDRSNTLRLAKIAGFPASMIVDAIKDRKAPRKNVAQAELDRRKWRGWLGLPTGENDNPDLPTAVQDAAHFDSEGYQAGLRAAEPKPPMEVPAMFVKNWMEGWHTGDAKRKWAEDVVATTPATPTSPPKPATPAPEPKEMTPAEKRKSEKDAEARAKASLDNMGKKVGDEIVDDNPLGANDALEAIREGEPELVDQVVADHGDGFESTPEELAKQAGRPARAEPDEEMV